MESNQLTPQDMERISSLVSGRPVHDKRKEAEEWARQYDPSYGHPYKPQEAQR